MRAFFEAIRFIMCYLIWSVPKRDDKFKMDFTVYAIRGDHVYRTLRNPDTGYRRIQRLKIMNRDRIKWD